MTLNIYKVRLGKIFDYYDVQNALHTHCPTYFILLN